MSRIAAVAGVSKGTLYRYFPSKADLFIAFMHRECALWISSTFEDLKPTVPPRAALHETGRRMFNMLLSEPALVIYRIVVAEAQRFPEVARSFYSAGPARAVEHLARFIRQADSDGHLRAMDAEFAAEQFLALIQTQVSMERRLNLIAVPSESEIEHVVENAVRLFMAAYGV